MIGMEARALKNLGQGGQLALWAPDSEFSSNSVTATVLSSLFITLSV